MALCLATSLVCRAGFHPYDQLVRYKWWYRHGYMSSTGNCFDIGKTTSESLLEFERRQENFAATHKIPIEQLDFLSDKDLLQKFDVKCSSTGNAGNGALMRLAPVPLFFYKYPVLAVAYSGTSGFITHGDKIAYDACRYYSALIVATLQGVQKVKLLDKTFYESHKSWFGEVPLAEEIMNIAEGSYKKKGGYDVGIRGSGYIVHALEAALWAFWVTNTFESGALAAVNLGDDTDTTAAIYGQLAGAYYGYRKLPDKWIRHIYAKNFILCLSKWIAYKADKWQPESFEGVIPHITTFKVDENIRKECAQPQLPPTIFEKKSSRKTENYSPQSTRSDTQGVNPENSVKHQKSGSWKPHRDDGSNRSDSQQRCEPLIRQGSFYCSGSLPACSWHSSASINLQESSKSHRSKRHRLIGSFLRLLR